MFFGSSRDVGHHSFNQIYRHGVLGIYRKDGAWIRVFPIRMVGASPKAFSASREIRKFFHRVCFDLILVETGVLSHWHCPMGAMRTPLTPPFHVGWYKVAGWSAWCWHTDLKNCKCQFRGLLWIDVSLQTSKLCCGGPVTILMIVGINIVVTVVVRTVS